MTSEFWNPEITVIEVSGGDNSGYVEFGTDGSVSWYTVQWTLESMEPIPMSIDL